MAQRTMYLPLQAYHGALPVVAMDDAGNSELVRLIDD